MKMKPSLYFLIVVLAFALLFGVVSLTYESAKMKVMPTIVSGLVLVLGGIQLRRELLAGKQAKEGTEAEAKEAEVGAGSELRRHMFVFAWLAGLVLAVYVLGFLIGIALFAFSYLRLHSVSWLKSTIMAAAVVTFVYFLFAVALKVDLFPGLIFSNVTFV